MTIQTIKLDGKTTKAIVSDSISKEMKDLVFGLFEKAEFFDKWIVLNEYYQEMGFLDFVKIKMITILNESKSITITGTNFFSKKTDVIDRIQKGTFNTVIDIFNDYKFSF